jgi:signal transduction histidine kinase
MRARVTVVASVAITVAVVLGLFLLYALQRQNLQSTVDGQLRAYVAEIAQSAQGDRWPAPLPPSRADANANAQVLAADGHVVAASRTLSGLSAVYFLPAGSAHPVRLKAADHVVPAEVRVVASRVTVNGHPVTIIASTGTGLVNQLTSDFASHLLLGIPLVLILAALGVWLIVGRTLRPVERIRRAVIDITSADLSRRVPEPGTRDEIGGLARTMNDMLGRLDDAAQRQRRFIADASHELRTPLAAIRTTLEVALAHPDQAPWRLVGERTVQQATRLEELIQQLLVLAKADERQLASKQRAVDVTDLLEAAVAKMPRDRLTIELRNAGQVITTGSREDLDRLFRNLLDNALRYASSQVTVITASVDGEATVRIDDDGPGIPLADRDRVFDRFVRLDLSRQRDSGSSGLGLAIAREIARAHRGEIVIGDSTFGGTRVTVTLPAAAP